MVVLLLTAGGGLLSGYLWITKDLPSIDNIHGIQFETTRIYDRHGQLLYEMYDTSQGKRTYTSIDQMPKDLINATIAVEDASFEKNNGVDPLAIGRALYINYTGRGSSGASTITQQLVRRVLLPEKDEHTLTRKLREAILAVRMTEKYSKEKILEIYLNEIYYGSFSYGAAAAADTYYGKPLKDLTLAQCAMLAGLPQLPGDYDPNVHFDVARARQRIVLDLMLKNGYITREQSDQAFAQDVHPVVRAANVPKNAPHFVEYVKQLLVEKYGADEAMRGGLKVFTTIDLDWQQEAQKIAGAQVEAIRKQGASNAALVAINPRTGEVLAMVGSVDYTNPVFGEVNVATSLRQPGSSFKPLTYATALERGDYNPMTIVPDLPAKFTNGAGLLPYVPQNYDGRFHGPVTMRAALANSYNIPAVEVLKDVGVPAVLDTAHRMGITTLNDPQRYGLALTLGGGEVKLVDMTSAFATFADYGYHVPATPFLKIVDSKGNVLEELNTDHPDGGKQAISSGVAFQISEMLSDNDARTPAFGPNSALKIDGIEAAVKTGTTNDWKDSWTLGYTPALAVGVWVGNNDGRPMTHVAGAIGAAPIWHNFIAKVYGDTLLKERLYGRSEKQLPEHFVPPPGMVRAAVCALSGMEPTSACTHVKYEWFTPQNLPQEACTWHEWVPVTLHDGGAHVAGPGVPPDDIIQRVYTVPPDQYRSWVGGQPPSETLVITQTNQAAVPLPTPVAGEPASIASLITPVPVPSNTPGGGAAGLQQYQNSQPVPGLQLSIQSPTKRQVVSGAVMVTGQAQADNFSRYRLEYGYGAGDVPMTMLIDSPVPPLQGTLGEWDTGGLQPGTYTLRLTLETTGGDVVRDEVQVRVGAALPSVSVVSPADGSPVYDGEAVDINVAPDGGGAPLAGVEIYVDGKRIASLTAAPWTARWAVQVGTHEIMAMVYTPLGEQARSAVLHVTSQGARPTPTATRAPIMWISRPTLYQDIPAGVGDVWVDVSENSAVRHVDIYIDGLPGGFATGPGYRVNPKWTATSTPTLTPAPPAPTETLAPDAASTATAVQATQEAKATRVALATSTRLAKMKATATTKSVRATVAAKNANATASVVLATTSATPAPPTATASPTATPTFVRYEPLLDPMLGDFVAKCQFTSGRHRVTAIGYDANNHEVERNETWVVVK